MTSLLDVNVLISLLDANHQHHAAVFGWWEQNEDPWASCPITQNGYLRIVTQEAYRNRLSITAAIQKLTLAVSTPKHEFVPDDISLLDEALVAHEHILGNKQLTDIYLLALAASRGARFVTLDQGVSVVPVPQATSEAVYVIEP